MAHPCIEYTAHEHSGVVLRYRLKNIGNSSDRVGPCDVCGTHVDQVFHLVSSMMFERTGAKGSFGWSQGLSLFGHRECLCSRRVGHPVVALTGESDGAEFSAIIRGEKVLISRDWQGYRLGIGGTSRAHWPTLSQATTFAERHLETAPKLEATPRKTNEVEASTKRGTCNEFKLNGIHYRVLKSGDIERYDGGSIGYTKTYSLAVRAEARQRGLID